MLVKDVMSSRKISVAPGDSITLAAQKMRENDIGCLLVEKNERLVGIVTDRDITCRGLADGKDISAQTVEDVMSNNMIWCSEDETIEDAIRLMEQNKIRRLPVMTKKGLPVSVISVGDISTHLSHELSGEVIAAVCSPDNPPISVKSLH